MSLPAEGVYIGRVIDQGFTETKAKKIRFSVRIRIDASESGLPLDPPLERTVDWYFTPSAIEYTIRDLGALGWPGGSFSKLQNGECDLRGVAGRWYCKHELAEGDYPARDRWSLSTGTPRKAAPTGAIALLDAQYADALGKAAAVAPGPHAANHPKVDKPLADSEIPF